MSASGKKKRTCQNATSGFCTPKRVAIFHKLETLLYSGVHSLVTHLPGSDSYTTKQNAQITLQVSVIFISHGCYILGSHSSFSVIRLDATNHCHGSLQLGQKKNSKLPCHCPGRKTAPNAYYEICYVLSSITLINYNRPPWCSCHHIRMTRGKSQILSML
jgi:hypothetical protein